MTSAIQHWTTHIPVMQQSVLLAGLRGPDGIHKNHVAKKLLRWYRRCILISAFDGVVLTNPWDLRGGSFTGPSINQLQIDDGAERFWYMPPHVGGKMFGKWQEAMHAVLDAYMLTLDEIPHHFQLHFLHGAEVLGYTHPLEPTRMWWHEVYCRLCNDMHLNPETHDQMARRLGDNREAWRAAEEVTAD